MGGATRQRGTVLAAGFCVGLSCAAALAAGRGASAAPADRIEGDVIVASTGSELIDRIKIRKQASNSARVALSLGQGALRDPHAGARVEGSAKLQFDVCPERSPTAERDCLGDVYGYDPHIEAYLLLASNEHATGPRAGKRLGRIQRITCRQDPRASNHHCVIALPWAGAELREGGSPCQLGRCRVNVVVRAWHPKAGKHEFVAFGGVSEAGDRVRGKSTLTTGRSLIGRPLRFGRPTIDSSENAARLPLSKPGKPVRDRVIYSLPVRNAEPFESIVVDARFGSSIRGLGRAVRTRTQLIFARSPTARRQARHIRGIGGELLSDSTNFNCTQRRSAHTNPCRLGERGGFEVRKASRRGFFINLIAGHGALAREDTHARAKVLDGRLKVWRYKADEVP